MRIHLAAGMVAAAVFLAGCGTASPNDSGTSTPPADTTTEAAELQEISVILDWSPNTNHSGLYIAQAAGYFADRGLEVTIVEPGETDGLQLVAADQADFALSVAESIVPARQQGLPVVSIATVIEHNTSSLVALTESGITRPKDLAGRTYGGYDGPLEKALISTLVECDGGDPSTVEFITLPGFDFRIGLTEAYYDTAWIFNGWDGIRLREVDGLDITTLDFLDYTHCIPDWYTPLIATAESTITEHPALVSAFLAATAQGYADAMADPAAAVEALLTAAPELDRELVSLSAEYLADHYASSPDAWGHQTAEVWNGFVEFLKQHGLAASDFDADAAWDDSFLPAA